MHLSPRLISQPLTIEWQKCFGGSLDDVGFTIQEDSIGKFSCVGTTLSNDGDVNGNHSSYLDGWIIKMDSSGNLIWQKCYGGSYEETGASITPLFNENFAIAGSANSNDGDVLGIHNPGAGTHDVWILEIDINGNLVWNWCYGGSSYENGISIIQDFDSTLIFTATGSSTDGDMVGSGFHGFLDAWIVKLLPQPNIITIPTDNISNVEIFFYQSYLKINFYSTKQIKSDIQLIDITGRLVSNFNFDAIVGRNENYYSISLNKGVYFVRISNIIKKIIVN